MSGGRRWNRSDRLAARPLPDVETSMSGGRRWNVCLGFFLGLRPSSGNVNVRRTTLELPAAQRWVCGDCVETSMSGGRRWNLMISSFAFSSASWKRQCPADDAGTPFARLNPQLSTKWKRQCPADDAGTGVASTSRPPFSPWKRQCPADDAGTSTASSCSLVELVRGNVNVRRTTLEPRPSVSPGRLAPLWKRQCPADDAGTGPIARSTGCPLDGLLVAGGNVNVRRTTLEPPESLLPFPSLLGGNVNVRRTTLELGTPAARNDPSRMWKRQCPADDAGTTGCDGFASKSELQADFGIKRPFLEAASLPVQKHARIGLLQ